MTSYQPNGPRDHDAPRGVDTSINPAEARNIAHLLSWATELSERDVMLPEPVSIENMRGMRISVCQVSWLTCRYLVSIAVHHLPRTPQGLPPGGWAESEEEAIAALAALRVALKGVVPTGNVAEVEQVHG